MKVIQFYLSFLLFYQIFGTSKILHLTFHRGCANEIEDITKHLNLHLTTWYIPSLSPKFFDPLSQGNVLYNIGHDHAIRIWNKNKEFFNQKENHEIQKDFLPLSLSFILIRKKSQSFASYISQGLCK